MFRNRRLKPVIIRIWSRETRISKEFVFIYVLKRNIFEEIRWPGQYRMSIDLADRSVIRGAGYEVSAAMAGILMG